MHPILLIEVVGEGLYSYAAYRELRLQMSTGDFHTHKTHFLNCDPSVEYTDIDDDGNFYKANEVL